METVLVLANGGGRPAQALLTLARRLGHPHAVTTSSAAVGMLGHFGAQAIWLLDAPGLDGCAATVGVEALAGLAARLKPCCVLIPEGIDGHEIAGRLAARLGSGALTGAVDLWMGPHGPVVTQRVLGGSYLAESEVVRGTTVCAVRTCEVEVAEAPADPAVQTLKIQLPQGSRSARLTKTEANPGELGTAAIVVAGGRGLGSRDGFELADRLAKALGGAAACSHSAAELGWCPPQRRVDQIGTAVHPELYVALGVSGSIRHRAGMQGARTIVAVDRDPRAPIFGLADLAIVGDALDVAKELLTEIDKRRRL